MPAERPDLITIVRGIQPLTADTVAPEAANNSLTLARQELQEVTVLRDVLGEVQPRRLIPGLGIYVDQQPLTKLPLSREQATTLVDMADALLAHHSTVKEEPTLNRFSQYTSPDIARQAGQTKTTTALLQRLRSAIITTPDHITPSDLAGSNVLATAQMLVAHYSESIKAATRENPRGGELHLFSNFPDPENIINGLSQQDTPKALTLLHPSYRETAMAAISGLTEYPFSLNQRLQPSGEVGEMTVVIGEQKKKLDLPMIHDLLVLYDQLTYDKAVTTFTPIAEFNAAVLRKMLGDYYVTHGDKTTAFHYYTNALDGQVAAFNFYNAVIEHGTTPKLATRNVILDSSSYNGFSADFASKEQDAVVLEIADTLFRRTLLDRKDPEKTEAVEHDFTTVTNLLERFITGDPANISPSVWHLYRHSRFQFGEFYQDIVRDPERATQQYVKAMETALIETNGNAMTDEAERRTLLLEGKVQTNNGVLERKVHIANLARISGAVHQGAANFYRADGAVYADVPEIVGVTGACENVATLFQTIFRRLPGNPFYGTQTGQLALELIQQQIPNIWTRIVSMRAESPDNRHLLQFPLTEQEVAFSQIDGAPKEYHQELMFEALLGKIESTTKAMMAEAIANNTQILQQYGRSAEAMKAVLEKPYLRVSYTEAIDLLKANGIEINWGDDLKADHERELLKLANERAGTTNLDEYSPAFVTEYPEQIKFFNMAIKRKDNNDPERKVVKSADLIVPYAGEAVGSAVREHEYDVLLRRLLDSNMYRIHKENGGSLQQFQWYLEIIRDHKTEPHAGYGIGNSRLIQWLLRLSDIRDASTEQLISEATGDWHDLGAGLPAYA